jgi:spore coat-associated protein N
MTHTVANRRKILVPLGTLLAAGAIAIGSGATFTATTQNPGNAFTTGTLQMTNSNDKAAIFSATNLKPGDTVNGTVTITNSGSLPAKYTLTEKNLTNTFAQPDLLDITITDITNSSAPTAVKTKADFGTVGTIALGEFKAGEARTYQFSVTLDISADNDNQGKSAGAAYTWDAIQVDNS